VDTPIGELPRREDLNLAGLDLSAAALDTLLGVDQAGWAREVAGIGDYLASFGERMPAALQAEQARVAAALEQAREPLAAAG
jgi:phosphoenolpyruvate carboxykinase (GTP)